MIQIRLTNTKTRQKEVFTPIDPDRVRLYLCGPTVYDRAHLGNARPVLVFDVLVRLLRHVYGEKSVIYARNFTDVDDKINAEAHRRKASGRPETLEELIHERTEETIAWYHEDMDALGAARPDFEPRATEYIGAMIAMIENLIASGHAYAAEGHVLFRVRSYENYGALSGRSVDDMIAGARVEVAPFKEDPMDFVLWKPSDADLPGWDSPWGRGRPGWHIECSAMSHELLGESFDIHGGGMDLQFPHHENEIAQSRCAHPHADFARVWLHNEMLQVEGKKMSKSLGNFFTVRDLLDQGIPGDVIRFVMLSTHYRKPMDWTEEKKDDALATLRRWENATRDITEGEIDSEFLAFLGDDLNTAGALQRLGELYANESWGSLAASARLMGLLTPALSKWFSAESSTDMPDAMQALIKLRENARREKNYSVSDQIRKALTDAGIELRDLPDNQVRPRISVDSAIAWHQKKTGSSGGDLASIVREYEAEIAEKILKNLE